MQTPQEHVYDNNILKYLTQVFFFAYWKFIENLKQKLQFPPWHPKPLNMTDFSFGQKQKIRFLRIQAFIKYQ